jgi:DNA-binding beta-propeller fold protein YncE
MVAVRGRARDNGEIAYVRVNGVDATTSDGFASWRVQVPLVGGDNLLTVETGDKLAAADTRAAEATVRSRLLLAEPVAMALDAANDRVLVADDGRNAVLAVDLERQDRAVLSDGTSRVLDCPAGVAVDDVRARALVTDCSRRELLSVDLASGAIATLSGPSRGAGPAFGYPTAVQFDAAIGRALVLDYVESTLVWVTLSTGDRAVLSGPGTGSGPLLREPWGMALDGAHDRALVVTSDGLYQVSLPSGDRFLLSAAAAGTAVTVDAEQGVAYVAADGALLRVPIAAPVATRLTSDSARDLIRGVKGLALDASRHRLVAVRSRPTPLLALDLETSRLSTFSDDSQGSGEPICGAPIALDPDRRVVMVASRSPILVDLGTGERQKLSSLQGVLSWPTDAAWAGAGSFLVVDRDLDALMSVDVDTGVATVVSDSGTGSGPPLAAPVAVEYDASSASALVLNGDGDLLRVEVGTGDRALLSSVTDPGPLVEVPSGLAWDPAGRRAWVADWSRAAVLAIDLATGERSLLADDMTGAGPPIRPVKLAFDGAHLLVTDVSGSLLVMDPSSGDRAVVGHGLMNPVDVEWDSSRGNAVIVDSFWCALFTLDPSSGDAVIVSR